MTDQQIWSLISACAVVMVPLGAMLGTLWRGLRMQARRWLPPRYLKRVGERRRKTAIRKPA